MICWLCDDYYALTTLTNRAWRVASCSSASFVFRCSCECFATLVFVERDLLDRLIFFFQDEMKAFARMGKAKPLRLIKLAVFLCLTCGKSMAFFFWELHHFCCVGIFLLEWDDCVDAYVCCKIIEVRFCFFIGLLVQLGSAIGAYRNKVNCDLNDKTKWWKD